MEKQTDPNIVNHDQFTLVGRVDAPEIFVEGWSQLLIGFPNTKILFHTVVDPNNGDGKESRRASVTLTIPLPLAVQLAQTILSASKNAEQGLVGAAHDAANQLKAILSQAPASALPPGMSTEEFP